MKKSLFAVTLMALATLSLGQLHADNIALVGGTFGPTGLIGVTNDNTNYLDPGFYHVNPGGGETRLNDGVTANPGFSTQVDTFAGNNVGRLNFEGIAFSSTVTDSVVSLTLTSFRFSDGGWFSSIGNVYTDGDPLATGNITDPLIQISTNFDPADYTTATWTTVSGVSSDYNSTLVGQTTGETRTSTFTFSTPISNFNGIRLVGYGGGGQHFISATEIAVNSAVPEPSTYALLGFGALALVVLRRRSLKA